MGPGDPTGACDAASVYLNYTSGQSFVCQVGSSSWAAVAVPGGGVPAGAIVFVISGTCPTGYSEVAGLDGKTILGTLNAHANVGGTGGADNITPAGTNSGTAVADHASHTHTYTQIVNHTHPVTSVGSAATGSTTNLTGASDTSSTTATAANPAGGVATGTTAGPSATLTHTVSAQPTFAGTQFDNRSAFVRLIGCSKDS